MKMGLIGESGLLGTLYATSARKHQFNIIEIEPEHYEGTINRHSVDFVIDCGFPRKLNTKISQSYLKIFEKRCKFLSEEHIPFYYIGSYSSLLPTQSLYGKTKLAAERITELHGGFVLRHGTVIDAGISQGRVSRQIKLFKWLPIIPLFHETTFSLVYSDFDDVLDFADRFIRCRQDSKWSEFNDVPFEVIPFSVLIKRSFPNKRFISFNLVISKFILKFIRTISIPYLGSIKSIAYEKTEIESLVIGSR